MTPTKKSLFTLFFSMTVILTFFVIVQFYSVKLRKKRFLILRFLHHHDRFCRIIDEYRLELVHWLLNSILIQQPLYSFQEWSNDFSNQINRISMNRKQKNFESIWKTYIITDRTKAHYIAFCWSTTFSNLLIFKNFL